MGMMSFDVSSVLGWLFDSTIYISLLICMIFAIKRVTGRKLPAWWSYGLWLLLVLRMLIPWGVESRMNIFNYVPALPANESYISYLMKQELSFPLLPDESDTTLLSETEMTKEYTGIPVDPKETNISHFNLSLDKALLITWFTGLIIFAMTILFKNLRFWMIIRQKPMITDGNVLDLFEKCRSVVEIRRDISVIETSRVKSPAIFGYFKPKLLFPPNFLKTLKKNELRLVFLHELGHLKRHDIGISWLVTFLQCIHWFNPFVWYAFHHMRVDQEVACDAYVLSRIKKVQPADYANTIVDLLDRFIQNRQLPSLAGIIENKLQIRRRITMIMNFKRYTRKMTLVSVVMLLIVGVIFFTNSCRLSTVRETPRPTFSVSTVIFGENDSKMSDRSSITQISADMNRYENRDWQFALNIPGNWKSPPPSQPMFDNHLFEVVRFGLNENGYHRLAIETGPLDPKRLQSLKGICDDMQRLLRSSGRYENFNLMETTIGSRKAYRLDFGSKPGADDFNNLNWRVYFVTDAGSYYKTIFGTTNKEGMFDIFDQIAMSFEILPGSKSIEMKPFGIPYDYFSLDIPARWHSNSPFPVFSKLPGDFGLPGQVVQFISNENMYHVLAITRKSNNIKQTLGEYRDEIQQWLEARGASNFTTSETTIGSKHALILECKFPRKDEVLNIRGYCLTDNRHLCGLFFSATSGSDMSDLYKRIVKSFKFTDSFPDIVCPSDDEYDDIVYKLEEVDQKPKVLNIDNPPELPMSLFEKGIRGDVVMQSIIGTDGSQELHVLKSEPEGIFEEAALAHVAQIRFKPAIKDGKCVKCLLKLTLSINKIKGW